MGIFKPTYGTRLNLGHPLAKGLVGCWLMNEKSGLYVYDLSGYGNHGISTNNPSWVGNALDFNGSTQHITIPHSNVLEPDYITVVCKFRSDRAIQYEEVLRKGDSSESTDPQCYEFIRGYPSAGDIRFSIWHDGTWRSGPYTSISTGTRVTAIGTYDGSTIRLYIDGKEVGTPVSYAGVVGKGGDVLDIARRTSGDRYFDGAIEFVQIFNHAFTPNQVTIHTANPYAMFEDPYPIELFGYVAAEVGWTGVINGVTNPAKINGIPVANIKKVMRI